MNPVDAAREFKAIVSKARDLDALFRATSKAASLFLGQMEKADQLLEEISREPFENQQSRLDKEFNPLMRASATPTDMIAKSSSQSAKLLTEISEIFVRTQK